MSPIVREAAKGHDERTVALPVDDGAARRPLCRRERRGPNDCASLEPPGRSGPDRTTGTGEAWSPALLSDREQAVLRLIAEGLPNKQIATALAIAERTVKTRVTSAMNKLGVDNRAHATVVAIRQGLL